MSHSHRSGEASTLSDLQRLDQEFRDAAAPEGIEAVPDGKYEAVVDRVEIARAKSTNNPMLVWTLRIVGPRSAGRLLFRRSVITHEGVRWLKHDLHLCGLELDRLSDLPAHLERLLDVKLEVVRRTKGESESVFFNRRLEEGPARAATTAPAATAPAPHPSDDEVPF